MNVPEGEMTNCWSSEYSSSSSLFFLVQFKATPESCKVGTHLTTEMSDKDKEVVIVVVLVLNIELKAVIIEVLVDML